MTIASVGSLGTAQEKANDNSLVLTTTATLEAGNVAVLLIASDNTSTVDGDNNEITGVIDSAGNAWVQAIEGTNSQGSANAGITTAIFWTKATVQLTSGGTITITWVSNRSAKAASAWEFTVGASKTLQVVGTNSLAVDGSSNPADLTITGLANIEHLFLSNDSYENDAVITYTKDAGHTEITGVSTSGGAAAANMSCHGGFEILTNTSNGNDVASSSAVDWMQLYAAFDEVDDVATGHPAMARHQGIPHMGLPTRRF